MVWCGVVWCGVVRCGAVRCGAVRCGAVRCGVVWCAALRCAVLSCCAALRCAALRCANSWRWQPRFCRGAPFVNRPLPPFPALPPPATSACSPFTPPRPLPKPPAETFSQFEFLWRTDIAAEYEAFMRAAPSLEECEVQLRRIMAVEQVRVCCAGAVM